MILQLSSTFLQFPNDPVALAEWFLFSIALIVIVTLLYVFVLNKTPTLQSVTVAKLEQAQAESQKNSDPQPLLQQASQLLQAGDLRGTVEASVRVVSVVLSEILRASGTPDVHSMSISDMAYIVQTRAKSAPQIAEPVYQLNNLRLKALQNQAIEQQEAQWSVSLASWLVNQIQSQQVLL